MSLSFYTFYSLTHSWESGALVEEKALLLGEDYLLYSGCIIALSISEEVIGVFHLYGFPQVNLCVSCVLALLSP